MTSNVLEHFVETVVGYAIDWNATGSWVGAAATALAVYLAARLTDASAARAAKNKQLRELEILIALYGRARDVTNELRDATREGESSVSRDPPTLEELSDVGDALAAVPVLDMPSAELAEGLMAVRRAVAEAKAFRAAFNTSDWFDDYVVSITSSNMDLILREQGRLGAALRRMTGWKPRST